MKKLSGYSLVLMTALISGFANWTNKFGVSVSDPFIYTATKNIVVVILLMSLILLMGNFRKLKNLTKNQWLKLVIIGVVGGSIPFLLFFYGLSITTAINASFMHKTMFIFVAIMAFFVLKERLTKLQLVGAAGLLIGLFFMIGLPSTIDEGALLVLVATLFWSVENVISKYVLRELPATIVAFGRMFFGSLVILAFLAGSGTISGLLTLNTEQMVWTVISSLFLFGYVMTWYHGLAKIQVSEATAILILGSATATLLNFGTQSFTSEKLLGAIIIILSTVLIIVSSWKAARLLKEFIPMKRRVVYADK